MHNVFVSLPSARGVHPQTMWNVFDMRTQLEAAGHRLHGASVYRMPLDLARNEMVTVYLSTTADMNLLLDDDVQLVDPRALLRMMKLVAEGADIVSAPCRLRDHSHGGAQEAQLFNIRPMAAPVEMSGERVVECEQTGLGAVLVPRRTIEKLFDLEPKKAASKILPGKAMAPIFTSQVEPASSLVEGAPEDLNVYILDDVVFSLKARKAGLKIIAPIDLTTCHDGMVGNFGAELERHAQRQAVAKAKGSGLVGADGRPVR